MFNTQGFPECGNKWWKIVFHFTDQKVFYNFFIHFWKDTWNANRLKTNHAKLSSVCLSKWEMHVILALPGSILLLKLQLIAMANGLFKTFADSFGWILSIPVNFLLPIFPESCFYITSRNLKKVAVSSCEIIFYVIFFYSFDTFMISKRLKNYPYCFFLVFNFLFFWNVGWFSSLVINKNPIFNSYCRPVTLKAFFKFILNYQFLRKFRIKFFWWLDIFSFRISLLTSPTK